MKKLSLLFLAFGFLSLSSNSWALEPFQYCLLNNGDALSNNKYFPEMLKMVIKLENKQISQQDMMNYMKGIQTNCQNNEEEACDFISIMTTCKNQ